ncbi:uncharacterized protein LOC120326732 isoform X1 [Styela clava]
MIEQEFSSVNPTEWIIKLVGHVMGASSFLLPFAMAHAGLPLFFLILVIEAYVTGKSLVYFSEMVTTRSNANGIQCNNFFTIVEHYLGGEVHFRKVIIRLFVRGLFMFDVLICTSFYFRVGAELWESVSVTEPFPKHLRNGYYAVVYICLSIFLLTWEYGERFIQGLMTSNVVINQQINAVDIRDSHVKGVHIHDGESISWKQDRLNNMTVVVKETHSYNYKRPLLLFLFMLLTFSLILIYGALANNPDMIHSANSSAMCPGILQPTWQSKSTENILHEIPIIIFSLMSYVIILPICVDNLELSTYANLVIKSKASLVGCLTVLALLVNLSLGESAAVIFPTAFGPGVYGILIKTISFVITLIAMLLRVMACCRLIQVLVIDNDSETHYWLIVITLFFSSYVVATWVHSVVYLVIIAGSVNCNLLLIILPRLAYIQFKWKQIQSRNIDHCPTLIPIIEAAAGIGLHLVLLFTTFQAIQIVDPSVGRSCKNYFIEIFATFNF